MGSEQCLRYLAIYGLEGGEYTRRFSMRPIKRNTNILYLVKGGDLNFF